MMTRCSASKRASGRVPGALGLVLMLLTAGGGVAPAEDSIREHYVKHEYRVPMRDGVKLFTSVYTPKDTTRRYPFLMTRTPYSVGPYGENEYRGALNRGGLLEREGFIFVFQDVRGRFMSEGEFVNMRPHVARKSGADQIDESTDTYDTIEWLLANVPNHNGRVGLYGISYPGFYSSAGMIDAHPALRAVSPQAPIADWFFDDFFHHGAFFLPHCFNFFASFGRARPAPTSQWSGGIDHGTPDGYQFFLELGPLRNVNEKYYHGQIAFWNEIIAHPNRDAFWEARNILPHLKNVAPAVMVVGGWYDAEDLYGTFNTYQAIERQNPDVFNVLVVGPWDHGGWAGGAGDRLGDAWFGEKTAPFYREQIELPFFRRFLKDEGEMELPEAYVFETGANRWRKFDDWPPAGLEAQTLYFAEGEALMSAPPSVAVDVFDAYVSDPRKPVPYTEAISTGMTREYMTDDQRFAARRPDVLVYQTPTLETDLTLAGPLNAELWVSTSGTDSDWVVKLIDVFPPDGDGHPGLSDGSPAGGYQMHVRSEVLRGRFRNGYERPEPFVPNMPTRVVVPLQDVLHTFRRRHRLMVQVQSTWFPLVDRNPQKFVDNIFEATEADFIRTTQRVYRSSAHASRLNFHVLPADAPGGAGR